MKVVATAGHVDHGKSTLVRALTGTDPDRWAEERRRGLTIDLGFAHTELAGGVTAAFVDVPGHERFIANMLAGLGPAPAVLFVVAADRGWGAQSTEHLAAVEALGIEHGVLVITRSDLADPTPALARARDRLSATRLAGCPAVAVSALTGSGIRKLRTTLNAVLAGIAEPDADRRPRLWVDRGFSIRGAGTVVTGTLESGALAVGDPVEVGVRQVSIRGLQALGMPVDQVVAGSRVAINLRGVEAAQVARGDTVTAGSWWRTASVDARTTAADLPESLMIHVGTYSGAARVRRLGDAAIRLTWSEELALRVGDRLVLRDPGRQQILGGAVVLDLDPPPLGRRGAAKARAAELASAPERIDVDRELARRQVSDRETLTALGADPDRLDSRVVQRAGWLIHPDRWAMWAGQLPSLVQTHAARNPMQARMPIATAAAALGLPSAALVADLATGCGLLVGDGQLAEPDARADLGPAETGLQILEADLAEHPFRAPVRQRLIELGLGPREIATAVRLGRLLDLGDLVVVVPTALAQAMRLLTRLPQPFTTSAACEALDTSRRVAIPLLERLDARGWTSRVDAAHRQIVRR